jgi:Tfp pilus assembly protein PilF
METNDNYTKMDTETMKKNGICIDAYMKRTNRIGLVGILLFLMGIVGLFLLIRYLPANWEIWLWVSLGLVAISFMSLLSYVDKHPMRIWLYGGAHMTFLILFFAAPMLYFFYNGTIWAALLYMVIGIFWTWYFGVRGLRNSRRLTKRAKLLGIDKKILDKYEGLDMEMFAEAKLIKVWVFTYRFFRIKSYYGVIDYSGNVIVPLEDQIVYKYGNSICVADEGNEKVSGVINYLGKVIIPKIVCENIIARDSFFEVDIKTDETKYFDFNGQETESIEKIVELNPNSADGHLLMGDAFRKNSNNYDKAIECYEKTIELNPNSSSAYFGMGHAYGSLGDYNKAVEYYQKSIDLSPDSAAYNNMGVEYKNLGNYDKAIECYRKAIELTPNHELAYRNMGDAYKNLGNYDKAFECYQKSIELKPDEKSTYGSMGFAYFDKGKEYEDLGNYNKAIECYEKVIELRPDYTFIYHYMGEAYQHLGNEAKADECFQKANTV